VTFLPARESHHLRARTALRSTAAFFTAACLSAPAWAGLFTVTPVRIFMSPRDRAVAITITNDGDEELVMQADVYAWSQKPGGEDELTLSEDLILSPPILKLAPKARQVVRLAMVSVPRSPKQLTYRMIVREIPEATKVDKETKLLQVALAFSLPVFITPPVAKRQLDCSAQRAAPDTLRVTCENGGAVYTMPREIVVSTASGQRLASRDSGAYILPGITRSFELKRAEGTFPGGALKVAVTLDDGSSQTYDVTVTD
jgi:fimbrial chaperone protein